MSIRHLCNETVTVMRPSNVSTDARNQPIVTMASAGTMRIRFESGTETERRDGKNTVITKARAYADNGQIDPDIDEGDVIQREDGSEWNVTSVVPQRGRTSAIHHLSMELESITATSE